MAENETTNNGIQEEISELETSYCKDSYGDIKWIDPVTDRSIQDVKNKESKAYLNVKDLNRIESNTVYLNRVLEKYLFDVDYHSKIDWKRSDVPTMYSIKRIFKNVENIVANVRNVYSDYKEHEFEKISLSGVNYAYLTFKDINRLEKNLKLIKELFDIADNYFRPASYKYKSGMTVFLPKEGVYKNEQV